MIEDAYFSHRDRAFTEACMPCFFSGSGGWSSGRDTAQARRERELNHGKQYRVTWAKELREETAQNIEQDKRELREARAAKIAGSATKAQLLIIQLAEIKQTFRRNIND